MRILDVFARAWRLAWTYRATWVLGALLALTAGNGLFVGWAWRQRGLESHNSLRLTPSLTVNFPGQGLSIDLTDPQAITIQMLDDGLTGLETMLGGVIPGAVRAVLAGGLILVGVVLAVLVTVRYVAEAGLIRMVAEVHRSGMRVSLAQGWRWGWSRMAWRLLLIDLLIGLGLFLSVVVVLAVTLAPLLLWTTRSMIAGVVGTALTSGLLVIAAVALASLLIFGSIVIQAARRQCAFDGSGVIASIRSAASLVWAQPVPSLLTWVLWVAARLVWTLATVPLAVLLAPLALLLLPFAAIAGGFSALVVGGLSAIFLRGAVPWIIGAIAGVPLFALTLASPILVASAPIETLKSSLWTLAVAELRLLPVRVKRAVSAPAVAVVSAPAPVEPSPLPASTVPQPRSAKPIAKRTATPRKPAAKPARRPAVKAGRKRPVAPKPRAGKAKGSGKRAPHKKAPARRRT